MIDTGLLLEYKDVFRDNPKIFSHYIKGIGIDTLIQFSSHFLSIDQRKSGYDQIIKIVSNWFSQENSSVQQYILNQIELLDAKLKANLSFINPISILTLFEYSFENVKEKTTLGSKAIEINLFKCILTLNTEYNKRDLVVSQSTEKLGTKVKLPAMFVTFSISIFDFVSYKLNELIITQIIKALLLFEFFESNSAETKNIITEFVSKYKCDNWKSYLKKYLPLIFGLLKKENEGLVDYIVIRDSNFKISCEFLDTIILNNVNELDDLDFKSVRTSPFFKIEEGSYRLISPLFSIEKIYEGLYFEFSKLNQSLKSQKRDYIKDDFRGFYCLNFSEQYLLYKILSLSIPKKHVKLSGVELKEKGLTGEPDYYWRNGNKVFLFESKDVLINAKIKHSADFNKIEESLKEKFYTYTEKGKTYTLGIHQLVNNINKILSGEYKFDKIIVRKARIYPILITHHNIYNTPGLNILVNNWFQAELAAAKIISEKIHDLIIIDINTFILYHEQFRSRTLVLETLIDDYISITKGQLTKLTGKSAYQRAKDSLLSFSLYTSTIVDQRKLWRLPQLFTNLGLSIFK